MFGMSLMQGTTAGRLAGAVALLSVLAGLSSGQALGAPSLEHYIKNPNPAPSDSFGHSLAATDTHVVVGSPGSYPDAVFVYRRTGSGLSLEAKPRASNADATDGFGWSVAISGDTLVVGAVGEASSDTGTGGPGHDNSLPLAGAAYVFARNGSMWVQQEYLKASNPGAGDRFGQSVAICGELIVVGAPFEDSSTVGVNSAQPNDAATNAGAAYIFRRAGTSWSLEAYLKASNADPNDLFGSSVSVSNATVLVGSPVEAGGDAGLNGDQGNDLPGSGAAYAFERPASDWIQTAYIKASNPGKGDCFGQSLSMSGKWAAVGALDEASDATTVNGDQLNDNAVASGAVYIFERQGVINWRQDAYLKSSNSEGGDRFGWSVAVQGPLVVVGAPMEDSSAIGVQKNDLNAHLNDAPSAGAAYAFRRFSGNWAQVSWVKALNPDLHDEFGYTIAASGTGFVVGTPFEDSSSGGIDGDPSDNSTNRAGAAYLFDGFSSPLSYCTPTPADPVCVTQIGLSEPAENPSSGVGDYRVTASFVQGQQDGLLFGGLGGPASIPFLGGVLCVQPPLKRGPVANSGGMVGLSCTGTFSTVVNDGQQFPWGLDAGSGNTAWFQYWYRAVSAAGQPGFGLSNAVQVDFE